MAVVKITADQKSVSGGQLSPPPFTFVKQQGTRYSFIVAGLDGTTHLGAAAELIDYGPFARVVVGDCCDAALHDGFKSRRT